MRKIITFCAALLCSTAAHAQNTVGSIEAMLTALPPLPALTTDTCLTRANVPTTAQQISMLEAAISRSPYIIDYDITQARRTAEVIAQAVETNAITQSYGQTLPPTTGEAFMGLNTYLFDIGINTSNAVDMTAFYLLALSSVAQSDLELIENAAAFAALRDQIGSGEMQCLQLARALGEMPDLTAHLMAHTGLLFEILDDIDGSPAQAPVQQVIDRLFGSQLAGRSVTEDAGLQYAD